MYPTTISAPLFKLSIALFTLFNAHSDTPPSVRNHTYTKKKETEIVISYWVHLFTTQEIPQELHPIIFNFVDIEEDSNGHERIRTYDKIPASIALSHDQNMFAYQDGHQVKVLREQDARPLISFNIHPENDAPQATTLIFPKASNTLLAFNKQQFLVIDLKKPHDPPTCFPLNHKNSQDALSSYLWQQEHTLCTGYYGTNIQFKREKFSWISCLFQILKPKMTCNSGTYLSHMLRWLCCSDTIPVISNFDFQLKVHSFPYNMNNQGILISSNQPRTSSFDNSTLWDIDIKPDLRYLYYEKLCFYTTVLLPTDPRKMPAQNKHTTTSNKESC